MSIKFDTLGTLYDHGFETLIDVRSPSEFTLDHVPGAVNFPSLSNDERARVGTLYKQKSPFEARKVGAALMARNIANAVEHPLFEKDRTWRPLIYCWRGGQRSHGFATILRQIGWRAEVLEGGYQSYRRLVHDALYDLAIPSPVILLDGNTGTAKTEILGRLVGMGVQVIDLEGMANHRGSLLGARTNEQPSQKRFESALAGALVTLDPNRPVLIEAESNRIGRLILPPRLWDAMRRAPRIEIRAPLEERARYLLRAYADIRAVPDWFCDRLQPLRHYRGHKVVDRWESLLEAGEMIPLALSLMQEHYDPAYEKSRAAKAESFRASIDAETLDQFGQEQIAREIYTLLSAGGPSVI